MLSPIQNFPGCNFFSRLSAMFLLSLAMHNSPLGRCKQHLIRLLWFWDCSMARVFSHSFKMHRNRIWLAIKLLKCSIYFWISLIAVLPLHPSVMHILLIFALCPSKPYKSLSLHSLECLLHLKAVLHIINLSKSQVTCSSSFQLHLSYYMSTHAV